MNLMAQFAQPKAVVGMIHVGALPGTPRHTARLDQIVAQAAAEAETYTRAGLDCLLIATISRNGAERFNSFCKTPAGTRKPVPLP